MKTDRQLVLTTIFLILITAATGRAWAEPATVSLDPAQVSAVPTGEQFTVNLVIADIGNLYGWQVNITFNPAVLNAVRVAEGPFLKNVNKTAWPKPVIDNSQGYIFASSSLMPPYPPAGATGSGLLANITFAVKSGGSSTLHFDEELTYFRTIQSGSVIPIEGVVRQDGAYGSGGGGLGGVPWELVAGIAAAVVIVVVAGIFLFRKRRVKAEGVVR